MFTNNKYLTIPKGPRALSVESSERVLGDKWGALMKPLRQPDADAHYQFTYTRLLAFRGRNQAAVDIHYLQRVIDAWTLPLPKTTSTVLRVLLVLRSRSSTAVFILHKNTFTDLWLLLLLRSRICSGYLLQKYLYNYLATDSSISLRQQWTFFVAPKK